MNDDPDEREIDCPVCHGDGDDGHNRCKECLGKGTVWVEAVPVTLADLDDLDTEYSRLSSTTHITRQRPTSPDTSAADVVAWKVLDQGLGGMVLSWNEGPSGAIQYALVLKSALDISRAETAAAKLERDGWRVQCEAHAAKLIWYLEQDGELQDRALKGAEHLLRPYLTTGAVFGFTPDHKWSESSTPFVVIDAVKAVFIRAETAEAERDAANARADAAERERDGAILGMSAWARRAGEAEGALQASEMAGVVDGWKTRAEAAEHKAQLWFDDLEELRPQYRSLEAKLAKAELERGVAVDIATNKYEHDRVVAACIVWNTIVPELVRAGRIKECEEGYSAEDVIVAVRAALTEIEGKSK